MASVGVKGRREQKKKEQHSLLLTLDSFQCKDDESGAGSIPTKTSAFTTLVFIVAVLFAVEHSFRLVLANLQHLHPILEIEVNRMIFARSVSVNASCCAVVAYLGYQSRAVCQDMVSHALLQRKNSMPQAAYEKRLYTYHPESQRVLLFFLGYVIKDTFDNIAWNDGAVFLLHHLLSGLGAWGSMYPGCGHFYALFYMGVSEASTSILNVLTNFDDERGVPGLADAFPTVRLFIAVLFVFAFIICRTIMWPYVTYHYCRDIIFALKSDSPQSRARKVWLWSFLIAMSSMTLLQMLWLFQICGMVWQEITNILHHV